MCNVVHHMLVLAPNVAQPQNYASHYRSHPRDTPILHRHCQHCLPILHPHINQHTFSLFLPLPLSSASTKHHSFYCPTSYCPQHFPSSCFRSCHSPTSYYPQHFHFPPSYSHSYCSSAPQHPANIPSRGTLRRWSAGRT
jgi:hypothetical protein